MDVLATISALATMVTKLLDKHAADLLEKDKEIASLKAIISNLPNPPK